MLGSRRGKYKYSVRTAQMAIITAVPHITPVLFRRSRKLSRGCRMKSVNDVVLGTAIFQSSLCAVYLLSSAGEVLSWNCGARQIKGWDSRDITGLHLSNFYDDDERAKGVPASNLATARTHGQYIDEGWRLRQDGSVFRASVEIEYLRPSAEQQPAFIKIVRDISQSYQEKMALRLAQQVIIRQNVGLSESGQLLDEVFSLFTLCTHPV